MCAYRRIGETIFAARERYRLPVPHGRIRDQAFSARAPAVQAHHIGGECRLVDKYEAGGIKPALLADPASARTSHVGALALLRLQTFFERDAMAGERRIATVRCGSQRYAAYAGSKRAHST